VAKEILLEKDEELLQKARYLGETKSCVGYYMGCKSMWILHSIVCIYTLLIATFQVVAFSTCSQCLSEWLLSFVLLVHDYTHFSIPFS
jgi:hypothetical protein